MSKTRKMLVDTARLLFAKAGVENTTMNDIAQASGKGRRTLYTYFKSKNEVYWAVIEEELCNVNQTLEEVAARALPPTEKLLQYIFIRMEAIKRAVLRNGTLKAEFFRDIWKVEQVRKNIDHQEVNHLKRILDEGVRSGEFSIPDTQVTASIMHASLKGLDVPYIRGQYTDLGVSLEEIRNYLMQLIFHGIKKHS